MKKILFGAILAIGSVALPLSGAQATTPPCAPGGGFGAQILKGNLSVGERTGIAAQVYTEAAFTNPDGDSFPESCALTNVLSVATFADGTTKVLVQNGSVPTGGVVKYFKKRVTVQPGFITDDPTLGPIVRIAVVTTALSGGDPVSGTSTYAVTAT